jgi:hypothetical protein
MRRISFWGGDVVRRLVYWELPIRTVSENNSSEHWAVKNKRHARQKRLIKLRFNKDKELIKLPCVVTLTRIAPRTLDAHDNLRSAFKWIVDAVADNLIPGQAAGRADDSTEITWEYKQQRGAPRKYSVRIEFDMNEI